MLEDRKPIQFVECKSSARDVPKGLRYMKTRFPKVKAVQLTLEDGVDLVSIDDILTRSITSFLGELI